MPASVAERLQLVRRFAADTLAKRGPLARLNYAGIRSFAARRDYRVDAGIASGMVGSGGGGYAID